MANVLLDELLPLIHGRSISAPDSVLREHLTAATADFLAATHLWREPLVDDVTISGTQDYYFYNYPNIIVESVLWVTLDGATLAHSDPRLIGKSLLTQTGKPQRYWVKDDTILMLHPIPDGEYAFSGEAALKPSRDATTIPQWLYETWADTLVDGAVWRIASIPGKSWSDASLALFHKQRFDRAKANALTRDLRQIELRVRPHAF